MSTFDIILPKTLEFEGSRFTDDPSDPGGATKLGISLRFLKSQGELGDIDHDGDIDVNDIKALTVATATPFYKKNFWDACLCDRLPAPLAMAVFDTAVNLGVNRAVKLLQSRMNRLSPPDQSVGVDGVMGPMTVKAVYTWSTHGFFWSAYLGDRLSFYSKIAASNKHLSKYLDGWRNRVSHLNTFIKAQSVNS